MSKVRVAVIQNLVKSGLTDTLRALSTLQELNAARNIDLIVLGEMFACPYEHVSFKTYAERVPDVGIIPTGPEATQAAFVSRLARENNVWIVGGSIPEVECNRIYNTTIVCDATGTIVAKYRKLHLFDVCIPPDIATGEKGIDFRESQTLSYGDRGPCVVPTPWGFDIGIGICYDLRFPEYSEVLRSKSNDRMKLLIYPGAFSLSTGPLHWELLGRARAVDTLSFCILASVARSTDPESYQAYGHSMIVSPKGEVLHSLAESEGVLFAEIDLSDADTVRRNIPTHMQKRHDVYSLTVKD